MHNFGVEHKHKHISCVEGRIHWFKEIIVQEIMGYDLYLSLGLSSPQKNVVGGRKPEAKREKQGEHNEYNLTGMDPKRG